MAPQDESKGDGAPNATRPARQERRLTQEDLDLIEEFANRKVVYDGPRTPAPRPKKPGSHPEVYRLTADQIESAAECFLPWLTSIEQIGIGYSAPPPRFRERRRGKPLVPLHPDYLGQMATPPDLFLKAWPVLYRLAELLAVIERAATPKGDRIRRSYHRAAILHRWGAWLGGRNDDRDDEFPHPPDNRTIKEYRDRSGLTPERIDRLILEAVRDGRPRLIL